MKFRKTHIWISVLGLGLLMMLLQIGGIAGGHDPSLMNAAIAAEGKLANAKYSNQTLQNELNKATEAGNKLKADLQKHIGREIDINQAADALETRIQNLERQIQQRGQ